VCGFLVQLTLESQDLFIYNGVVNDSALGPYITRSFMPCTDEDDANDSREIPVLRYEELVDIIMTLTHQVNSLNDHNDCHN
jgi:hypothetical protein